MTSSIPTAETRTYRDHVTTSTPDPGARPLICPAHLKRMLRHPPNSTRSRRAAQRCSQDSQSFRRRTTGDRFASLTDGVIEVYFLVGAEE